MSNADKKFLDILAWVEVTSKCPVTRRMMRDERISAMVSGDCTEARRVAKMWGVIA